jgi:peptidoglycan biosynthesis protein MviN/MurJ (putative lipid II flippase)
MPTGLLETPELALARIDARARGENFAVVSLLAVGLGAVAAFGVAASILLPKALEGRIDPGDARWFDLFFSLLSILLPYLPLICLVAVLSAILNVYKHFTMPALAAAAVGLLLFYLVFSSVPLHSWVTHGSGSGRSSSAG